MILFFFYFNNIMSNKLILPFSTNKSKNNKTFRLLTNKELTKISSQKGRGILNIIKKTVLGNVSNKISSNNNSNNKVNFMKASNSKKYYESIKNKKSGGYLKEILFPTGLSAATTVLGLTALQHSISKMNNKKNKKNKSKKSSKK
jgi:hypothetical protein